MKGEAGTISDLVYVLYEKRAKRGGGLVAPRRPSRCQSDREIGEIVWELSKLSFRFSRRIASIPSARLNVPGLNRCKGCWRKWVFSALRRVGLQREVIVAIGDSRRII